MRLTNIFNSSLLLLATALRVGADFQIAWVTTTERGVGYVTVASSKWNCDGIANGFKGVTDVEGSGNAEGPETIFSWHMNEGLCGVSYSLDFCRSSDFFNSGRQWDIYEHGAPTATGLGTCSLGTVAGMNCGTFQASSMWDCKANGICGANVE